MQQNCILNHVQFSQIFYLNIYLFELSQGGWQLTVERKFIWLTLYLPDQICSSPYYQPYNSYNVSWENLVMDQLIIPQLIFFFILITCLLDIKLIL